MHCDIGSDDSSVHRREEEQEMKRYLSWSGGKAVKIITTDVYTSFYTENGRG